MEDTISIQYRFGNNDVQTGRFTWADNVVAVTVLNSEKLGEVLNSNSKSKKLVFKIEGESITGDNNETIPLYGSSEAIDDLKARYKDLTGENLIETEESEETENESEKAEAATGPRIRQ